MYVLLAVVISTAGCASTSSEMSVKEAAAISHLEISSDAKDALQKFKNKVEPGMSTDEVERVSQSIKWTRKRKTEKNFHLEDGKEVRVWEYGFYMKKAVLKFEKGSLVSLETRENEETEEFEEYLQGGGK